MTNFGEVPLREANKLEEERNKRKKMLHDKLLRLPDIIRNFNEIQNGKFLDPNNPEHRHIDYAKLSDLVRGLYSEAAEFLGHLEPEEDLDGVNSFIQGLHDLADDIVEYVRGKESDRDILAKFADRAMNLIVKKRAVINKLDSN